mgnify:CR=1 FL=1
MDPTAPTPKPSKIKFTSKVRRGLGILRSLHIDAACDEKPPMSTALAKLKAPQVSDYNAAMAWIEANEVPFQS